MRTARFRRPHVLHNQMSALVGIGGPEVNKFEQVSSDGHQMSLAKGMVLGGPEVPCPGLGGGGVLRVCPCKVRSNGNPPFGQADTYENITSPQRRWRAVIIQ